MLKVIAQENVSRDASDMFLDQGVAVDEVVDAVGWKDVFELESVDARGVRVFDVEVVGVVVEKVGDADAERLRVPELAVVDPVHE